MTALQCARWFGVAICVMALAACSNGRGSVDEGEQQTGNYTVGGAVSGLSGSGLVLQLNGAGDLTIAGNGAFTFAGGLADGVAYNVTIRSQPSNPAQTCAVSSGAGRVSSGNVSNVAVVCAEGSSSFSVGGAVTGLTGAGLILRNNGSEDLPINADGEFIFPTPVATGAAYDVTVAQQPSNPAQTCSVEDGSGVMGSSDVTVVRVICSTQAFTIGGAVSGLAELGLRLTNNGEVLAIAGNGEFTFRNPVASGASYEVKIAADPPGQQCAVANGSGTVTTGPITNVAVTCATNLYRIGGTIQGLAPGARVVVRLNAAGEETEQTFRQSGAFALSRLLPNGTGYTVRATGAGIPSQDCTVSSGEIGIVNGGDVTNVVVNCVTRQFRVGGRVDPLQGGGLVLRLNGANDLRIDAAGTFTFPTPVPSGSNYAVAVAANPPTPPQNCTVANGEGRVEAADVTNVRVTCALNTYEIRGSVVGLANGVRLVLLNNGADPVEVMGSSTFRFSRRIATGSPYNVTLQGQPAGHSCAVENGAGTVVAADISNIVVRCQAVYTVGGTISGLAGGGLVLRNGDATLSIAPNATSFQFPQSFTTGAAYNVTVDAHPSNPTQTCAVANGSGTIGNASVTNIAVTCTTNTYPIAGFVSNLQGFNLQLQNNGGDTLTISSSGGFTFPTPIASGQTYNVTVSRQPDPLPFFPPQTCTVANAVGTVGAAAVTDVVVTCQ